MTTSNDPYFIDFPARIRAIQAEMAKEKKFSANRILPPLPLGINGARKTGMLLK